MKRLVSLLLVCLLAFPMTAVLTFAEAAEVAQGLGVVATDKGRVSGVFENGVTYFKGIPFAKPPVGELRWAAPVDAEPWEDVKACDTYAPMAMQILSTTDWWGPEFYYDWFNAKPPMSEDCLYLNVVTPATAADANLPVLVWIHGGANMHGYSWEPEFEPSKLAAKGVIVVSVEYRMGVFGYFGIKLGGGSSLLDTLTFSVTGVEGDRPEDYAVLSTGKAMDGHAFFAARVAALDAAPSAYFAGSSAAVPLPAAGTLGITAALTVAGLARRRRR
jgi:hypothetical protein